MTPAKRQGGFARGRPLVLVDIGIVLLSSAVYTSLEVAASGSGAFLERIPALLMVMIAAWALYAGYAPVRWGWVVINLGLAAIWGLSLIPSGDQSARLAIPMAAGHGFVGLTLALSPSARRFLSDRRASQRVGGSFDPIYTAALAFLGLLYLWCLGGIRDLLGWQPGERGFTLFTLGVLGPLAVLNLVVAGMRSVGLSMARPATAAVSFLLAAQFPHGTAAFLYWWLKVRERERRPLLG